MSNKYTIDEEAIAYLEKIKSTRDDSDMSMSDWLDTRMTEIPPSTVFNYGATRALCVANYMSRNESLPVLSENVTNLTDGKTMLPMRGGGENYGYRITRGNFPILEIELGGSDHIVVSPGAMLYHDEGFSMLTETGGIGKAFKKAFSGESIFTTKYINNSPDTKKIALAAGMPGQVVDVDLCKHNNQLLCQRGSYLASYSDVDISVATTNVAAGMFGGEGFILQKLTGTSHVFLFAGGEVIEKDLKPGEKLVIDTGAIVAFESTVNYSVQRVKGFKNMFFSGEGLANATLTGPGKIYLQSLSMTAFMSNIKRGLQFDFAEYDHTHY